MDPVEALRELGGVATFRELIAVTRRAELRTAVREGRIHKPRHDRYCLADAHDTMRAVARTGGTASHLSAAQEFGWKLKHDPVKPCITPAAECPQADRLLRAALGRPVGP